MKLVIMPILASEALKYENKNSSNKMLLTVSTEPLASDSKSNTLLSGLLWHVLLWRPLNFCLDFDDLVRINRAGIYKEPEVSVLQANVKLVQNGECWTWNQRLIRGLGSIRTGANIGIITNFVCL